MRLSATLACHMRLERFPMDVQVREPIKIMHFMMWQEWNYYDLLESVPNESSIFIPKLGCFLKRYFKACDIQIESFGYDMTDLAFGWSKMTAVELSRRIELPQFILRG